MALSKQAKKPYAEESLVLALEELKYQEISIRQAAAKYGIPKSTLSDYASGKVKVGRRPGPLPVLTPDEEKRLVEWTVEMAKIGYGQTS